MVATSLVEKKIIAMWASGMSGTDIGLRLSMTRHRVLGMIYRLRQRGVRVERAPGVKEMHPRQRAEVRAPRPPSKPVKKVEAPKPLPPREPILLEQLTSTTCRWPYGDVKEESGVRYCGAQCSSEATYCAEHHSLSRTKRVPLEPRVARKISRWGNMRVMPD